MIKDKNVCEVTEPTEFVNPLVIVAKSNSNIRVCLDPQALNEVIMREHYQLPTFEDIVSDMSGSKYFSTLDARNGFWYLSEFDR